MENLSQFETDLWSAADNLRANSKLTSSDYFMPATNAAQHTARQTFDPAADRAKGLIKQVDLLYKLASRVVSSAADLADAETVAAVYDRRKLPRGRDTEENAKEKELRTPHPHDAHRAPLHSSHSHVAEVYDRRTLSRLIKQLDEARRTARDLLLPWLISGEIEVA